VSIATLTGDDGRKRPKVRRTVTSLGWGLDIDNDVAVVTAEQAVAYCRDVLHLAAIEPTDEEGSPSARGTRKIYGTSSMRADRMLWLVERARDPESGVRTAGNVSEVEYSTPHTREIDAAAERAKRRKDFETRVPDILACLTGLEPEQIAAALRTGESMFGYDAFETAAKWRDPADWPTHLAERKDRLIAMIAQAQAALETVDECERWLAERTVEDVRAAREALLDSSADAAMRFYAPADAAPADAAPADAAAPAA
jgi:hypothetical protein